MRDDDDKTKIVRTLKPGESPSSPSDNLYFDWRLDLLQEAKDLVTLAINDLLRTDDLLTQLCKVVVITRFGVSDDAIQADLRDGSGTRLAVIRIEERGWGKAYLIRNL